MKNNTTELNVFDCQLEGRQLIEASAGTGKTYTITSLYIRLLLEKRLQPSEILVVTFTEAATAELKERIRSRLKESSEILISDADSEDSFLKDLREAYSKEDGYYLKEMLQIMDEAAIHTIHGFCNRLLTEHSLLFGTASGFEITTDLSEMLQDCTDEYWREFMTADDEDDFQEALISLLRYAKIGPDTLRKKVQTRLQRPYAKLIPEPKDLEIYKGKFNELKSLRSKIREVYEEEKDLLETFYFGESLKGNIYKKDKKREYYNEFQNWLRTDKTELFCFEKMNLFGTKMPESVKKNKEAPELGIFELTDRIIALIDELSQLIFQFISNASQRIIKKLHHKKEQQDIYSYDDLLNRVEQGLTGKRASEIRGKLLRKYPAALVDEFQDTDPVQYRIFHSLYSLDKGEGLFMIGDPKQAIYGFRGADIHTYLQAKAQSDEKDRYGLFHNYRSSRDLIGKLNTLFSSSETPFLLDDLNYYEVSYPNQKPNHGIQKNGAEWDALQFIQIPCDPKDGSGIVRERVAESVVNEIVYLLESKDRFTIKGNAVQEKDIAVLVRNRYEGEMIRDKLRQRGLFSVLRTGDSVLQSSVAEELAVFLKAVLEPDNDTTVRAALSTDLIGYKVSDIEKLSDSGSEWTRVLNSILNIRDSWLRKGIGAALNTAEKEFQIAYQLCSFRDAHRRLTNFRHLKEILIGLEREHRSEPAGVLKHFRRKIFDPTAASEEEEIRLENDEDLIQIMTIHASKGLEFPVVYNPFLWDSIKPPASKNSMIYVNRGEEKVLDIRKGSDDPERKENEILAYQNEASEALRLLYVALTRAEYLCLAYLPEFKDLYLSPLGMLVREQKEVLSDLTNKNGNEKTSRTKVETILDLYTSLFELRKPTETSLSKQIARKPDHQSQTELATFERGPLTDYPSLISYSSIAGQIKQTNEESVFRDHDESPGQSPESNNKGKDRFTFPRGARTGNLLHDILEESDFQSENSLKQNCLEKISEYGFEEEWSDLLVKWMKDCINTSLNGGDLQLSALPFQETLREMEFHLKLVDADPAELFTTLQKAGEMANEGKVNGFLKGYIDLVFRWKNKYYLLDYKSNYLGDQRSDYKSDLLQNSMKSSSYDLQYHIYSVALDAYLSSRLDDYTYESHFGGAYYLYLRGMHPGDNSGIYFDRPDEEKIQKLKRILTYE